MAYEEDKDILLENLGDIGGGMFAEIRRYDAKDGEQGHPKLRVSKRVGKKDRTVKVVSLPLDCEPVQLLGNFLVSFAEKLDAEEG